MNGNALQRTTANKLFMGLVAVLRVVSLACTVLVPSVLLLQRLVSRWHSVHALLYSFHLANHARCFTLSCFLLAQYLLHCCNCIPRSPHSHCGVPILPCTVSCFSITLYCTPPGPQCVSAVLSSPNTLMIYIYKHMYTQ